jgi:hypothetical protein
MGATVNIFSFRICACVSGSFHHEAGYFSPDGSGAILAWSDFGDVTEAASCQA